MRHIGLALLRVLGLAYWIALFVLTHLPPKEVPKANVSDKLVHLVAYFILGIFLHTALSRYRSTAIHVLWILMAYGALDELTQPLVGRSCELADWCADVAGGAAAVVVMAAVAWTARRSGNNVAPSQNVSP